MIKIVDSHCHLDMIEKKLGNSKQVIENCQSMDMLLLNISVDTKSFNDVVEFSNIYQNVYSTFGIHPCYVDDEPEIISHAKIVDIVNSNKKIVGIGETGIDLFYGKDNIELQKKFMIEHMHAAKILGLPCIFHVRDSFDEVLKEIKIFIETHGNFKFLIHCFTGDLKFANEIINLGGYISFSGILTYKKSEDLRELLKNIDINRVLSETDSPYLAPQPFRGKDCLPNYVVHTIEVMANVLEKDVDEMAKICVNNFLNLFSKVKFDDQN